MVEADSELPGRQQPGRTAAGADSSRPGQLPARPGLVIMARPPPTAGFDADIEVIGPAELKAAFGHLAHRYANAATSSSATPTTPHSKPVGEVREASKRRACPVHGLLMSV
jgi:hypothetical protein